MNIYFVRHGETQQNHKNTYYGKLDVSLNSKGIKQMNMDAEFFKNINIDKAYISDKKRAYESFKLITHYKNVHYTVDSRLSETDFGDFEGKNYEEILKLYPKECAEWEKNWQNFTPPNGESYTEMYSRIKSFMNDIMNTDYNNILVVTHSGVIRAALCYVMDNNLDLFWKFSCKNGDRVLIKYEYENLYIDSITHAY